MPFLPALSEPWAMVDGQMRKARAYLQELMNNYQAYSIPERVKQLRRALHNFDDIRGTLDNIHGAAGNQSTSYGPDTSDNFDTIHYGPGVFNSFDNSPYGPESKDIARLRNQCDIILRSIRGRLSTAIEEQQDSSGDSNGARPVTYGDDEWMHDMGLDINRMLSMAAFGPFRMGHEPPILGKDRWVPVDTSTLSSRNEMSTSSARRDGEAASRLPGSTRRQAAPKEKTPQKSVTKPTQGRPAEPPAADGSRQQGQAAVETPMQTDHPLQLGRSSPVPLPLPTDVNKLPNFKRKKKRAEPEIWTQNGKPSEQNQVTDSNASRRQEASPRTSLPRQMSSAIPSTPLSAPGVAPKPLITPGTTPTGPESVKNPGRKRSASSTSERSSGAGPSEWYKKQRTVGPEVLNNGTKRSQVASWSNNLAAAGRQLWVPASLPPKPPVSMPTSQYMGAVTQVVHGTGLAQHTDTVMPAHTNALALALGSAGSSVAPHRQGSQPRAVPVPSNNPNVPSTENPHGSGVQHTTFDLPQRDYVRYRQPAPASSLQGLSLPAPSNASGSAGPQAMGVRSGHQLAVQASPYSLAHRVRRAHASGAAPRSMPAASSAGLHGFFSTGHRQPPWRS